ncbi:acyltransferase [Microlunatus sp. GCM10028923]|uniref:acyltransferase n=1 Tax=Microlunatus sp. GCM10028923 TaxID=3273400 RepID=UPI0036223439
MSLWSWLDGGLSQPGRAGLGQRLVSRVGLFKARRHARVHAPEDCLLHPDALIHPRGDVISFGASCVVSPGAIVQGRVTFGDHCSIQSYAVVVGYPGAGIMIGNDVRIAPHAMLIGADHVFADPGVPIRTQGLRPGPIVIEDDVWVAGRVMITAGVRVGTGSVIAAGAVVTRDVPPMSVVAGVPARVIKSR